MGEFDKDFLIRIISDASKAKTDIDYTRKQLLTLEDTAKGVGSKLGDIERLAKLDALGNEMGELAKKTGDVDAAVIKLTEHLHDMGASAPEINRATSAFDAAQNAADGGGGGGTSKLTQFGAKLRGLPSTQIPGTGIGTDAIANIIRVLGALPPVALPVIAVIGAVGGALALMNKGLEEGKKALDAAIEAENKYYQAVADLTTAQAREQIATLQRRNDAIKEQNEKDAAVAANAAKGAIDSVSGINSAIGLLFGQTAAAGASLLETKGTVGAVTDNIDKLNAEYDKNQIEIDKLTQGLDANAFAANDAAEAEKKLAAIRDQLAEDTIARAKRDADLKRNGSADQIQAQIDSLNDENAAIQSVLDDVASGVRKLSDDELEKLHTQLTKNTTDIGDLTNNILKFGKANDIAKQAAKDQDAAQKDLQKTEDDAAADDKKRADDIDAINAKTAAAYTKLADAYKVAGDAAIEAAKQQDAKTARTRADEDVKTALDRQAKLEAVDTDAAQKEVDRKVKLNEALKKIDEEFAFSSENAIQERDAVALDRAQAKRDKDKTDAISASQDEQKQIADDREKRFKELRKEFELQDKETKLQRAAQDRETKIARDNDTKARREKYFRDQNDLAAAQRADLLARNNAYVKQISDLKDYLTTRIATDKGYFGTILSAATKFQSDLSNILGGGSASSPSGGGGSSSPNYHNTVPRPGHYAPTQDLDFIPNKATAASSLNPTYIINGSTKSTIKTEVVNHLDGLLNHMGVA